MLSANRRETDPLNDIRILIVDDHKLFAEAVSLFLQQAGATAVGVALTGADALAATERERPDLVLIDLNLPDEDGLSVGAKILDRHPEIKVVAVTALSDRSAVRTALENGFHGYLTKDANASQFATSLRSALAGQVSVPHDLTVSRRAGAEEEQASLLADQLTPRERQTLALLAEGASSEEIAKRLSVSPNTVRTHVHNLLTKLGAHSRLEAAAFAVRHGLVPGSRPR